MPFIAQFVCLNQTITYKGVRVKKLTAHSLTVKLLSIGRMPVGQKGATKFIKRGKSTKKTTRDQKSVKRSANSSSSGQFTLFLRLFNFKMEKFFIWKPKLAQKWISGSHRPVVFDSAS